MRSSGFPKIHWNSCGTSTGAPAAKKFIISDIKNRLSKMLEVRHLCKKSFVSGTERSKFKGMLSVAGVSPKNAWMCPFRQMPRRPSRTLDSSRTHPEQLQPNSFRTAHHSRYSATYWRIPATCQTRAARSSGRCPSRRSRLWLIWNAI